MTNTVSPTPRDLSVIVTGGASGIGAAVCRRVVESGGHVAVLDLNAEASASLSHELGRRAIAATADVLDEAALAAVNDRLVAKMPPISGLAKWSLAYIQLAAPPQRPGNPAQVTNP